jgi:hypothetical protein
VDVPLRLLLVTRESITGLLGERLVISRLAGSGGVVSLSLDHVDSLFEVLSKKRGGGVSVRTIGGRKRCEG